MKRVAAVILLLAACGCSGVPFKEAPRVPLAKTDPSMVCDAFREKTPGKFSLLASIMFEFNLLRRMAALGTIEADAGARKFTAAVFNPVGVKLFELASAGDVVETRYVIGALAGKGDLAGAVGGDIARVYFDLVPSPGAKVKTTKYRAIFEEKSGSGRLRRIFSGSPGLLSVKEYRERGDLVWRIRYYQYREVGGKLFPGGVVLDNFKYGYRLVVKLKEVYPDAGN